jgi:hypothetical protein
MVWKSNKFGAIVFVCLNVGTTSLVLIKPKFVALADEIQNH